jgi:hypothetical protein
MKTLQFELSEKALSESDIREFSKKYGFELPDDYVKLIQKFNGGVTADDDDNVFINGKEAQLVSLYSIRYGEDRVEDTIETLQVDNEVIPRTYYPFGNDGFGNVYVISLEKDDYGSIHVVYLDSGGEMFYAAKNLNEFFGGNFL